MPRTKGSLKTVTIIFNQRIEPLKKCIKACTEKYRANMDQTVKSRVDSMQEARALLYRLYRRHHDHFYTGCYTGYTGCYTGYTGCLYRLYRLFIQAIQAGYTGYTGRLYRLYRLVIQAIQAVIQAIQAETSTIAMY